MAEALVTKGFSVHLIDLTGFGYIFFNIIILIYNENEIFSIFLNN